MNFLPRFRSFQVSFRAFSSKTLVIAQHNHSILNDSTLNAITAAKELKNPIDVLLMTTKNVTNNEIAKVVSQVEGLNEVKVSEHDCFEHNIAENITDLVLKLQEESKYSHILAPATSFGKNFLPQVAALLDAPLASDVTKILSPTTFQRPIYAGNAVVTVECKHETKLLTIRTTKFQKASLNSTSTTPVTPLDITVVPSDKVKWVKDEIATSDRPDLSVASVVISGGRGLKNGENFSMLYELADVLNGSVGASRAAVDAGYVSNDLQVGQTGKVVAPDLYIAVGISGAIQHLAGMKDSKVIVAINKDPEAPIFSVADYGIVGDLFKITPELIEKLKK